MFRNISGTLALGELGKTSGKKFCALGAVPGPQKNQFASVYTAMSGPNTCTLCNKMCGVWSVFVKAFKRVKAASHIGLKGILALKRALERLWRHQKCACALLYSMRIPNRGFLKL